MKTLSITALSTALVLLAGPAAAQSSTDEARALAAQATAAQQREALSEAPQTALVSIGDYRAEAHEQSRRAQWLQQRDAVRAYAAGVRSAPIAVGSEDSARAEAQRVHAEQALAAQAAVLHGAVASR